MPLEENTYDEIPSGRVDTLVQAIERIERLENQLEVAVKYLKKLTHKEDWRLAREALKQIKELENDNRRDD